MHDVNLLRLWTIALVTIGVCGSTSWRDKYSSIDGGGIPNVSVEPFRQI